MVFERDLIDFETADRLAQANGIPMDAPERLDAGLLYTLKLAESSGHLSMHKEHFVQRAVNLLRTPTVTWKAVANGHLKCSKTIGLQFIVTISIALS